MEIKEAIHVLDFMRNACQKLIDEKVDEGRMVGTDVTGTWKAKTPLNDAYREHIDALTLAISALEKQEAIKSCTPPSDDWEHYADRLHDIAYQSGYEQGKKDAEQDRWIPVTERLPEDYTDVLVWFEYFRYGNYNRLYQSHGIGNYSKRYDSWTVNHETGWRDLRVFAWRPLPEPYNTEGEA